MHQLCDACNRLDRIAYIVYLEWGMLSPDDGPLYADLYSELRWATFDEMIDGPDVTVVVPEVLCPELLTSSMPKSRLIWWWLSWDNGVANLAAFSGNRHPRIKHAFQSRYAQNMAQRTLRVTGFFLPDYINESFYAQTPSARQSDREFTVVYNANKDTTVTRKVCERLGVSHLGMRGMTQQEVARAMRGALVYIDMGAHPGADRMPREAARMGCVVITGVAGSAGNEHDVPIAEKCRDELELESMLHLVLADYEGYFAKQAAFRRAISTDKARCFRCVSEIF
jgi:hypothetical protein